MSRQFVSLASVLPTAVGNDLNFAPLPKPTLTVICRQCYCSVVGLFLTVLCLTLWVLPVGANSVPVRQVPIDYSRMTAALKASGIPLHLPTKVVYALPPGLKRAFYGTKGGPNQDGSYEIYIGHPDCPAAALSCTIALATAEPLTNTTASIEQAYPPVDPSTVSRVSPDPRGWVTLAGGRSVYFVPWVVGASMGFAQVIWDEGGYRYTIGLKGGDRQWLLQMANTAFGYK